MLKRFSAVAVMSLVALTAANAGPMGPVKPTMGRFGVEFEASADERDMQQTNINANKSRADNINYLGRVSYGLTDKVEVSVRLGGADLDIANIRGGARNGQTYNGTSSFAWGVALSGILYDAGTWNLAGTGNYLGHSGHNGTFSGGATNNDIDYSEWNLGAQLQGKYDQFLPYVGIKYSDASLDLNRVGGATITGSDFESDDNVGIYVGAGWDMNPNWMGYLEGRFVDETAFGGGIRYTF